MGITAQANPRALHGPLSTSLGGQARGSGLPGPGPHAHNRKTGRAPVGASSSTVIWTRGPASDKHLLTTQSPWQPVAAQQGHTSPSRCRYCHKKSVGSWVMTNSCCQLPVPLAVFSVVSHYLVFDDNTVSPRRTRRQGCQALLEERLRPYSPQTHSSNTSR